MSEKMTRDEYVASEYKKWEEKFDISFDQKFEVKALLSLQYQFITTPDEHIKTKADVISTIGRLKRDLNLKPSKRLSEKDKVKVLIIVDNSLIKNEYIEFLIKNLDGNIETSFHRQTTSDIETHSHKITVAVENELLRGKRADIVYKLQEDANSPYRAFTKLYTTSDYDINKGRPME